MTELEAAWLAGFMDGEGTFGLYRARVGKTARVPEGYMTYRPRVQIVGTHEPTLMRCRDLFSEFGNVRVQKRNWKGADHWRTAYTVMMGSHVATLAACEALLPFLITKREPATVLLEFLHTRSGDSHQRYSGREDQFYDRLRRINSPEDFR